MQETKEGILNLVKLQNSQLQQRPLVLENKLKELEVQLKNVSESLRKETAEKQNLEKELESQENNFKEAIVYLKQIINSLDADNYNLNSQLEDRKKASMRSQNKIHQLEQQVSKLKEKKQIEKEATQDHLDQLLKEVKALKSEKEALLLKNQQLNSELQSSQEKTNSLKKEVSKLNGFLNIIQETSLKDWLQTRHQRRNKMLSKRLFQTPKTLKTIIKKY